MIQKRKKKKTLSKYSIFCLFEARRQSSWLTMPMLNHIFWENLSGIQARCYDSSCSSTSGRELWLLYEDFIAEWTRANSAAQFFNSCNINPEGSMSQILKSSSATVGALLSFSKIDLSLTLDKVLNLNSLFSPVRTNAKKLAPNVICATKQLTPLLIFSYISTTLHFQRSDPDSINFI